MCFLHLMELFHVSYRFHDDFHDLCFCVFQEFDSSVSDIVEDILKMHDTTKVIILSFSLCI